MDPFSIMIDDLRVVQVCLQARVRVTGYVLQGAWRWFPEVEIVLPIPEMPGETGWKATLGAAIIDDMLTIAASLKEHYQDDSETEISEEAIKLVDELNDLWRELAGCLSDVINESVPEVPLEMAQAAYDEIVNQLVEASGDDEETVRKVIKSNPTFRMMLRRNGIAPDSMI